ncbi:MAG: cytochrome c oxidase assembly protein [Burkholderiales bacterium]|nr:cytochrome c oxidase assembly protein [Burkholderiales bacterium]
MLAIRVGRRCAMWLAAAPGAALAHEAGNPRLPQLHWSFEPWVVLPLLLSLALYAAGAARLWRHAGRARGLGWRQVAAFGCGWLALAAALVSPLDALGSVFFSAHMLQHEALMLAAAPLLVLGRPLAAWAWALPAAARRRLAPRLHARWLAALWRTLTDPVAAWALHALALWLWHVPRLFEAALHSEGVHVLQHTSFLATALLFWWAVLGPDTRSRRGGAAMPLLFTTMLHTGALGALLALAPTPWYPHYVEAGAALGVDPVQDQQLGGLVMWVPGSVIYMAVALHVAARWLRRAGRTTA